MPWVAAVFGVVLLAQLVLVRLAGTDVPFFDQWDVEGRWLYPAWSDGALVAGDLLRPLNEHRIAWTHALNVALFSINGQWDPLVQLAVIAVLRAGCAAGVAWVFCRGWGNRERTMVAIGVSVAFLPHLAWHSVLWGIESQVYFCLGFSLVALALLGGEMPAAGRRLAGILAWAAAMLAMGAANFVPVALLALAVLRAADRRRMDAAFWSEAWPALAMLALAWLLRIDVPEHYALRAGNAVEFLRAAGRTLGWPHVGMPLAAIPMNLPLMLLVALRVRRRRSVAAGEDQVLLLAIWSALLALGTAWARGGSPELSAGVPSRYVDFLVLLPLANAWCAWTLMRASVERWQTRGRLLAMTWAIFALVGWVGLSAEVMRGIILPRARDREAPMRLIQAYQASGDAAVFAGQPRLLVPHPHPATSVRPVLDDPRLRGKLPPSLQPREPTGPLSRAVRWIW